MAAAATASQKFSPREDDVTKPSAMMAAATEGLPNQGGAKLELTFVDHQGNPSLAQQLATRLITQDAVHVLMGAYQSSCSFTATAVAERYGIPFMVGESAALNITGRGTPI
jgi:branched-chain amino acid transport system substrate-binding protein